MISFSGIANSTYLISDVSLTSNSITFTIDGDMTGYTEPSSYATGFSIEYSDSLFLGDNSFAPNNWSTSVFDNETLSTIGNTGTWYSTDYTWSYYYSNLKDSTAINRTITVSTYKDYFDVNAIGTIDFMWGHPLSHTIINSVIIDPTTSPVPEPGTMILMGLGLVGLAGVSRKKMMK